jgi:hypothetical protein
VAPVSTKVTVSIEHLSYVKWLASPLLFWKSNFLFLCLLLEFTLQKTYMHTKVTVPKWIHTNYTFNNNYYNSFLCLRLRKDKTEYHRNQDTHYLYPYMCTTKFRAISRYAELPQTFPHQQVVWIDETGSWQHTVIWSAQCLSYVPYNVSAER